MVWIVLIVIVVYILYRFFSDFNKDSDDLQGLPLEQKFAVIVGMINDVAFNSGGEITKHDKRSFNLYEDGANQIVSFLYSTGHLTITWKYKYYQKELVHERQFRDVRNLSIFEQQKIGEILINEMSLAIARHKANVLGGI